MHASKSFHSSLPTSGFCTQNHISSNFITGIPGSSNIQLVYILAQYKDYKIIHDHIPTEQSVGEKQEYSLFYLQFLVQMLYPYHIPAAKKQWQHKFKPDLKRNRAQNLV